MIRVYEHYEKEYDALRCAAAGLTLASAHGTQYRVEDVYWDYGANLKWTTIVAYKKDGSSWQALNPKNHELIVSCDIDNLVQGIKNTINSKYNPDR